MSALTVEVLDTEHAAEGVISFSDTSVWYCMEHSMKLRSGRDCPFCVQEQLTPAEFDRWLGTQGVG